MEREVKEQRGRANERELREWWMRRGKGEGFGEKGRKPPPPRLPDGSPRRLPLGCCLPRAAKPKYSTIKIKKTDRLNPLMMGQTRTPARSRSKQHTWHVGAT